MYRDVTQLAGLLQLADYGGAGELGAHHTEEDHAGAGAPQRLVSGGRDDVAVLKGLRRLLGSHQSTACVTRLWA